MKSIRHILVLLGLLTTSQALASDHQSKALATGRVTLAPELTAKAKGLHTLFISVYDPKSPMPMPYAAMKIELTKDATGEFQTFSLSGDKLMVMGQGEPPQTINIKVKLPSGGGAGPDKSGDLVGMAKDVKLGSDDIKISINKAIQ